jgi:DNA-binding MarR family transcriptional regulator
MHASMTGKLDIACACGRIRRASRALTRLYDESLADAGLTTTQFGLLRSLGRIGPASVTELAAATGHERSALTRLLRPLVDAGFVADGAGSDQRSRGVALTDAGRAAIARGEPGWARMQARVEAALGVEDRDALFALLERIEAIEPEAAA